MSYGYAGYGYGAGRGGAAASIPAPALALDFVSSEVLDPRITPSGGTNGTRVNSAGNIVAGVCPRFDYNPTTRAPLGLLVEEARTNLILRNAELDHADWVKISATISANLINSPAGTLTGDKLVEDSSSNIHIALQTVTSVAAQQHTFSIYAKAGERSVIELQFDDGTTPYCTGYYDLNAMTATVVAGAGAVSILDAGNGWRRLIITAMTTSTAERIVIYLHDGNSTVYAGDGVSGAYLWGGQMEVGAFATSWIPTLDATVTRAPDTVTMTGTNFTSWFNPVEGTMVAEFDLGHNALGAINNGVAALTFDATHYIGINIQASNGVPLCSIMDTALVATLPGVGAMLANVIYKDAISYKVGSAAQSFKGQAVQTGTPATIPAGINSLRIGRDASANAFRFLSGHLRKLNYYNSQLSNANLVKLST